LIGKGIRHDVSLPSPDSGLSQSAASAWAQPVAQADVGIAMGTGNGVAVLPPSCADVAMTGHGTYNK
jgi:hypothetical protein